MMFTWDVIYGMRAMRADFELGIRCNDVRKFITHHYILDSLKDRWYIYVPPFLPDWKKARGRLIFFNILHTCTVAPYLSVCMSLSKLRYNVNPPRIQANALPYSVQNTKIWQGWLWKLLHSPAQIMHIINGPYVGKLRAKSHPCRYS